MFPTVSHFIEYLFGVNIPLPFNTFGVFVALAFVAGYWAMSKELQRKEMLGVVHPVKKKAVVGAPASAIEIGTNAFFGFLVGYKLVYGFMNYGALINDAQSVILSADGNFLGGVAAAVLFGYLAYADKEKTRLATPKTVEVSIRPHQLLSSIVIWAAIWGFLGAKLFDNLENWDSFVRDPIGGLLSFSGLTFYGGLICGGAAVIYIAWKNGIKPIHMLDVGGPGMMLAYGVGRIGCQLSGDGDWGIVNLNPKPIAWMPDWMWAYTYPNNVAQEGVQMANCVGKFCFELPQAVYPTPLYEVFMALTLFVILWSIRKAVKTPGVIFGIYLIMAGLQRIAIESIRVNSKYQIGGFSFTQAELISTILIIGGIVTLIYANNRKQKAAL